MSNIPAEYKNDFGFTAVDDPEVPEVVVQNIDSETIKIILKIVQNVETEVLSLQEQLSPRLSKEEVDHRLQAIEKLMMPLLQNLKKNPEKKYIHWPNRDVQVDEQIKKLLELTRG
jgi:hypothetical protein